LPRKVHLVFFLALLMIHLVLLAIPAGALAEHYDQSIDISTSLGWLALDKETNNHNGLAWGFGLGLNFSEKLGAEFAFQSVDSEYKGYDSQIFLYRLDCIYHLTGRLPERIIPYAVAGLGMATFNNDYPMFEKNNDFLFNTGVGLKYFLTKNIALRGDVRYILDMTGSDSSNNFLYTAGINLRLGWTEEEPQSVVPVVPVVREVCPSAPQGCLEEDWCKRDADSDGVVDCLDKCPGTPAGTKVEANGCPPAAEQGAIIFRNILFNFNKADLKPDSFSVLDQVIEYLKANPGISMEIQGHTDNIGSQGYNLNLSRRRAESVRTYLVEKGIPPERLEVKGFGLSKPTAPNDTGENRARNRRVEFKPM
jgi:OmpA-OmpF porin, OOP family